ncbi:BolA family protein [Henriciella sp.]|uniref:BolA family protein n=1 Tax=Henriciella sp. TaxID=1968823 RepID=UPI0032EB78AE
MTNRTERIRAQLTQVFSPSSLEVIDDSGKHAGHAGASPEGETHYTVRIVSDKFEGMNRVAMQRAVNAALKDEFETGLHALSIKASAPDG